MPDIRIERTDLHELASFLAEEGVGGTPAWRPSRFEGPVVVASASERILGAARLHRYWLHPSRWRLAVLVTPSRRREGIGGTLVHAVVAALERRDDAELQTSLDRANVAGVGFLGSRGFRLLMTTRIGSMDPAEVPEEWLRSTERARQSCAASGIRIASLAARPDLFQRVAYFHDRLYRDQHRWDPPAPLDDRQMASLFLDEGELDPEMQFLALAGDRVVGVASLRTTPQQDLLELGWVGALESANHRSTLIDALVGRCVSVALAQGATVDFEVNDDHVLLNRTLDGLPVTWESEWLTFVRTLPVT